MASDYTVYEKTALAFKKLETNPGDVVIISFPPDIHPMQMQKFGEELQPYIPQDVAILCTREGVAIETVSELQMNKLGWYKFDITKAN